jgi:hypothetical protein
MIKQILVIADGKEDNTLDIVKILESLPLDNKTDLIVTDQIESAIRILSSIKPKAKLTLIKGTRK